MKKIFLLIVLLTLVCSCGSLKKTKSVTNVETEAQRKKDSIAETTIASLNKKIEVLNTEKSKLETSLKEKEHQETNTDSEIKLHAEIDPLTGKYKPAEYNETSNGVVTKSISISGNGEVLVKTNSKNSKETETEKKETFENEFQQKLSSAEIQFNKKFSAQVSENEKLKAEIRKKEKEVQSSSSSFWWGFKLGVLTIIIIAIILWLLNKKFSIFTKIKNLTT